MEGHGFLRMQPDPFMNKVGVEVVAQCDTRNRGVRLCALEQGSLFDERRVEQVDERFMPPYVPRQPRGAPGSGGKTWATKKP